MLEEDIVYRRIKEKFSDGTYTPGNKCGLQRYYYEDKDIRDFSYEERTPEVCVSLMAYARCSFLDVPEKSKTRDFYIEAFSYNEVYDYIKDNIGNFDREFFKDLITSNKYSLMFSNNCFEIMPLEYIDDELCSLAILKANGWTQNDWFYSVCKRKKEALSEDVWKLGARLYAREFKGYSEYVDATPLKYKDEEYYKELCYCNFNEGIALTSAKGKVTSCIPDAILTNNFLVKLIQNDTENIIRFDEELLEKEINWMGFSFEIWKLALKLDGYLIRYMELNDERIEFFMRKYPKDSAVYNFAFKDRYRDYRKQKENKAAYDEEKARMNINAQDKAKRFLVESFLCDLEGIDHSEVIQYTINRDKKEMLHNKLPIHYRGFVPVELRKELDSDEYLEKIYKDLGIEILYDYDELFYEVILPENLKVENDGYWNKLVNEENEELLSFFHNPKFYDRSAYVDKIYVSNDLTRKREK